MAMNLEEWSTWSAAMSFFGHLHATERVTNEYWREYYRRLKAHDDGAMPPQKYLETYPELRPLGDPAAIERFIVKILGEVQEANGGLLPKFRELPVTGSDQPLLIPEGMLPQDVEAITEAAVAGVEGFDAMLRKIDGLNLNPEDADAAALEALGEYEDYIEAIRARDGQLGDDANEAGSVTLGVGTDDEREVEVPAMTAEARRGILEKAESGQEVTGGAQALAVTHQVAGYAVFLGSVADCVQSFADIDGSQRGIALATDVLNGVAAVSTTLATIAFTVAGAIASISSAMNWVGVILTVLAYLCALVVWVIGLFDHAYGSLLELGWIGGGSSQEWDNPACIRVLGERLRVICQAEPELLTPEAITAWTEVKIRDQEGGGSSAEKRKSVLHWCLQALSLRPEDAEGADRDLHANAVMITRDMGRVYDSNRSWGEAAKLCDDIRQWMLYAGADPDEVAVIYQWLYESHKVTVVNERQKELVALPASSRCQDGPSRPNSCILMGRKKIDQGSAAYFAEARNLPYNSWAPFPIESLRSIHELVRGYLVARDVVRRVDPWSTRQIMQSASYCNPSTAIWGGALDATIPEWIMPVGDYTVLVYPQMSSRQVRPQFRDAYFSVTIGNQLFGCIAVVRDLWDRGFEADGVEPVYGEVPRRQGPDCEAPESPVGKQRSNPLLGGAREQAAQLANIFRTQGCGPDLPWPLRPVQNGFPEGPARPYATAILCVAQSVEIPTRYAEAPQGRLANTTYRQHQATINSAEFKGTVAEQIAEVFGIPLNGSSSSKALGVFVGLAAAAGLGFAAYKAV